ncbi:MAG TPA: GNAT family N-acetyltransferase [Ktedonobacterales bacterium]|nr:GNAT family N-acetyltransferase [Ktedonobacterales bacterium]
MDFEVRPVTAEEFPEYSRTNGAAFGHVPTDADTEQWRTTLDLDLTLAAYDAGRMVGTAAAFAFDLTVPGGAALPVSAVTWVAVLPTDRRRGVLRAMMRRQLDDARRHGKPIAVLTASESTIYGRFGYGIATSMAEVEIDHAHAALRPHGSSQGRVRLIERERALEVFPAVWDRHWRAQPGALSRSAAWWEFVLRPAHDHDTAHAPGARFFAIYESAAGEPEGAVWYRVEQKWELGMATSALIVDDLIAPTLEARAALWDYLFGVDLVATVRAGHRPVDDPLRWMLVNSRRLRVLRQSDDLWLRLLDIPAALAARRYAAADRVVLEVTDVFLPENAGRYALDAGEDEAVCRTTMETPDLTLDVADLGAAYLGGVSFATLAQAGRVHERRAGALRRADALFATVSAPYNGTGF